MKPAAVWAFSRPHTMYGTAIAVPAIGALAGGNSIAALPAALCANAFVTGLNQITDVEVDRINKPFLPLPSAALDTNDAIRIVVTAAFLSILLSLHSKTLLATTASSIALGTMYSLPPRLKRFPLFAALSIIAVRGIIINVGFYSYAVGRVVIPYGLVAFFGVFAAAIAIMKDVPDTKGDFVTNTPSYALLVGRKKICRISSGMLVTILLASAVVMWSPISIGAGATSIVIAWRTERAIAQKNVVALTSLYQFYWKVFYLSYVALFFV